MLQILDFYYDKIPILGVCLGHQAIAEYFGATITKAQRPMHGKISKITHYGGALFQNIPDSFSVVRYHSLIVKNLPHQLKANAHTPNMELMALSHQILPIYGIQFHPEAVLTEYGLLLIHNWLNIFKNSSKKP
jgi:anthranilate synthase component 2